MAELTVDIIETFIASLSIGGAVNSLSTSGGNTTIFVDNIYHARPKMPVNVDTVPYKIVSVDRDANSITFVGLPANPLVFTLNNPFYFHGTAMATSSHISKLPDVSKVPMIYLHEIFKEIIKPRTSRVKKEAILRMFFFDTVKPADWDTDDQYALVVNGLNELVEFFIEAMRDYYLFYMDKEDIAQINHINSGEFRKLKGHIQSIFNEHLSGIELNFTLPIRKSC